MADEADAPDGEDEDTNSSDQLLNILKLLPENERLSYMQGRNEYLARTTVASIYGLTFFVIAITLAIVYGLH